MNVLKDWLNVLKDQMNVPMKNILMKDAIHVKINWK